MPTWRSIAPSARDAVNTDFTPAIWTWELRATLSIESGLRHAIDHGGLELFYQPTFALADGSMQSVEALVRWPHLTAATCYPPVSSR